MAKEATFIQKGENIDYVAGADIVAGEILPLTTCIAVACDDIANGATGAVTMTGVIQANAIATAAFAVGDALYWDDTANKLTNVADSNTPAGTCIETKLQAGTTAKVLINAFMLPQQAAIADLAGGADLPTTVTKVNAVLAMLRTAGIIATS